MICPICKNKNISEFKRSKSGFEGKVYQIQECKDCKLRFINSSIVDPKIYEKVYSQESLYGSYKEYYTFMENVKNSTNPLEFLSEQNPEYASVKNFLQKNTKIKNILDLGCGLGYMTYALNKEGYLCTGVDLSDTAIKVAKKNFGEENFVSGDIAKLNFNKKFDLIVCLELIEHIEKPFEFLELLKKHLEPNGKILITTPLIEDQYPYFSKYYISSLIPWFTDIPPIHLYFFSLKSFNKLGERLNLETKIKKFYYPKKFLFLHVVLYKLVEYTEKLYVKTNIPIIKFVNLFLTKLFNFLMKLISIRIVNNIVNKFISLSGFSKFRYIIFENK
jgi:2-polyprenyl-3-methyl-5-hydroxy-6-metoxy-1,4-benzoquinol methylase